MSFRFAIIGSGLTGTSMLYQFVRLLEHEARSGALDPICTHILVFEKRPVAGPGFPHNPEFVKPYHITNMCAGEMSVSFSQPQDFSGWIESRRADLEYCFPVLKTIMHDPSYHHYDCSHYPRALMGEYLKARFRDALTIAEKIGIKVEVHTECEVINIEENERGLMVFARDRARRYISRFATDRLLLSTGHWPRKGSGRRYCASPWPANRLLEKIPTGSVVGVIGSSLSAIETVLTLSSDGRFTRDKWGRLIFKAPPKPRRISMLSRHGLLPSVRNRFASYQPRSFNQENLLELLDTQFENLTLDTIFRLLDQEMHLANGQPYNWKLILSPNISPMDILSAELEQSSIAPVYPCSALWQTILRQAFPVIRELYLALSPVERKRFNKEYATYFFAHAASQPRINAEKMLALMRAGLLEVVTLGHAYELSERKSGSGYRFIFGENKSKVMNFPYIVDARGQEQSLRGNSSQLIRNLLGKNLLLLGSPNQSNSVQSDLAVTEDYESGIMNTGSIWIDPESHHIMQVKGGVIQRSDSIYAVGAMTRGQIIDVSMARGLTRSTHRIATNLVNWLCRKS